MPRGAACLTLLPGGVDAVVDETRASRRAAGTAALHAPGDLESRAEAHNRDAGIPLNDTTLDDIRKAAAAVGGRDILGR